MKEFIEKLIGRLEEELKLAEIDRERYLHGNSTQFNYGKAVGYGNAVSVAIEIVNQLAEEFSTAANFGDNDFCEWELWDREVNMWKTTCKKLHVFNEGGPLENVHTYCPFCGKKIKIVEQKGE